MSLRKSSLYTTTQHTVRFAGRAIETTVTNTAATVDNWLQSVRLTYQVTVGLECELMPKPPYCLNPYNKVATLQLCVGDKCLILKLLHIDFIPQSLRNFLAKRNVTFVGFNVGYHVDKLRNDYGLGCVKWADLELLCRIYLRISAYEEKKGLKEYAREILGLVMDKPQHVTMSNWGNSNLTDAQVQYGCIDAYVSYKLGNKVFLCQVGEPMELLCRINLGMPAYEKKKGLKGETGVGNGQASA